jgi:tetratricopeptide (TPR) repeat protein
VWEILCTIHQPDATLEVVLSPSQRGDFERTLFQNFDTILRVLEDVDAKSLAFDAKDQARILDALEREGCAKVNKLVCGKLREWLLATARGLVAQRAAVVAACRALRGGAVPRRAAEEEQAVTEHALALQCVGVLLDRMGRFEEAGNMFASRVDLFREALASSVAATQSGGHGEAVADVVKNAESKLAFALNDVGQTLVARARYAEVFEQHREALAIRTRLNGGADHAEVATRLQNVSGVIFTRGSPAEALPYLKQALAMWSWGLGEPNDTVATCLSNLSQVYVELGRPDEALPLDEKCLAIRLQILEPWSLEVATARNNTARVLCMQGKPTEALELYHQVRPVYEKVYGAQHPDVAAVRTNEGLALLSLDRFAEAETTLVAALTVLAAVHREQPASCHPATMACQLLRGEAFRKAGVLTLALPLLGRALHICRFVYENSDGAVPAVPLASPDDKAAAPSAAVAGAAAAAAATAAGEISHHSTAGCLLALAKALSKAPAGAGQHPPPPPGTSCEAVADRAIAALVRCFNEKHRLVLKAKGNRCLILLNSARRTTRRERPPCGARSGPWPRRRTGFRRNTTCCASSMRGCC